ncbi:MAG: hypothetical protein ACAI25_06575 [Planctomycetota bacterium]
MNKNIEIQGLVSLGASEQVSTNGGKRPNGGGGHVNWGAIGRQVGRWIRRHS